MLLISCSQVSVETDLCASPSTSSNTTALGLRTVGGARNVVEHAEKRAAVVAHITTFTCRASHYIRRGTPGRKYLPCDLNVRKMHALFAEQNDVEVQVTYSLYYDVFRRQFNLGFGHPVTDVCATCASYRLRCKDQLVTDDDRRREAALFILHLSLPKTPIGQAYYSRQLSLYVFAVVVHRGRGNGQPKQDVHLYMWQENENRKDSNLVASALNDCLRHHLPGLRDVGLLRLFSDSCFGQNKNMNWPCC